MTDAPAAMTRQALLELAARCEAATGADRELDAAIARVVGTYHQSAPYGELLESWPHYTASLDAAVSLVPEGWLLLTLSDIAGDGLPFAKIGDGNKGIGWGCARTTVLALTAACLRALAQEIEREPK